MSHGDKVSQLPAGFSVTASTPSCPIAMVSDEERRFYGIQFHPEVTHTSKGAELLSILYIRSVAVVVYGLQNILSICV